LERERHQSEHDEDREDRDQWSTYKEHTIYRQFFFLRDDRTSCHRME
jgi:hypothetical protein